MTAPSNSIRNRKIIGTAILLTTLAELFYLLVWGIWLFPQGSLVGKVVWTLTCGLAMGAVIGGFTLILVEPFYSGSSAIWRSGLIVAVVGSYCAWLCSRIDTRFGYFGGSENTELFITAGVVPALAGGALYGWLLYRRNHVPLSADGTSRRHI